MYYKIAVIVAGVYYSLLALSSFVAYVSFLCRTPVHCSYVFAFSLIGTFTRSHRALAQYGYWLWWAVGLSIALDVWNIVTLFRADRDTMIKNCINGSEDLHVIANCDNQVGSTTWKVVVVVFYVVTLLIQCCESTTRQDIASFRHPLRSATGDNQTNHLAFLDVHLGAAYIVSSYAKKLQEDAWQSNVPLATGAGYPVSGYKYEAAPGRASMEALNAPSYAPTYPYADANHSFGTSDAPYDPHQKA